MKRDDNEKDDERGEYVMSKGQSRKTSVEVNEKYMRCVAGAILQRNFAHNVGLSVISIVN